MSHDCKINYTILKNLGISINKINGLKELQELKNCLKISDATIDAIFGTGLSRDVEGIYSDVISCINDNANYIFSIDIPSGLSGNTGNVLKNCIRADKTISFQLFKRGFMKYGVDSFIGDLIIEDIGIPKSVIEKFNIQEFLMDKYYIKSKLKERNIYAHKGDFGRTLVIAGSAGFSGAAYISTQSAVKSGSGLVTLACSKDIQNIMSEKLTEAMTVKLEEFDKVEKLIKNADSIAIGPGMGNNETTLKILKNTIENSKSTVVIDADGINVLKDNLSILKNKSCRIIMTPHLGEMSRITGLSIDYIKENRIEVSKEFAKKTM
jgi:ADP-dependent NAD(P)H-hydrate dehydratase / NAD(P)H-hydrate epimerase